VLPIYSDVALNGPTVRLCGDTVAGTYNKIGNRRFLRFNVPSQRAIDIQVSCFAADASCTGSPQPDPDFGLFRGRSVEFAETSTRSRSACTRPPRRGITCSRYTSTVTSIPIRRSGAAVARA